MSDGVSEQNRIKLEKVKLDLQYYKLNLVKDGKVPQFTATDVTGVFKRVAEAWGWSDVDRVLLLQFFRLKHLY